MSVAAVAGSGEFVVSGRISSVARLNGAFNLFDPRHSGAVRSVRVGRRTGWLGRQDSNLRILESVFAQTLSPGARTRICASRIEPHFLQTSQAPDRRLHPVEAR